MPYFSIETNRSVDPDARPELLRKVSAFVSELLGKPESYVMAAVKPETPLLFGGSDAPAALVSLKSIGLPGERCPEFSEKICAFVEKEIGIPPERVFIDFRTLDGKMFGWNRKTF